MINARRLFEIFAVAAIVATALFVYLRFFQNPKINPKSALSAEIEKSQPEKINLDKGLVSINFDDGYLSQYQIALPILERAGMKATFYIITQMHDAEHMTDAQVLDLYARGNEIGAHTRTHPALVNISKQPITHKLHLTMA